MPDPTIAVALRYDPEDGRLPQVTAKGREQIAAQILAVAAANDIPVRRDVELTQILSQLDIGDPIPTAVYAAVAEILAYLYRLDKTLAGSQGP